MTQKLILKNGTQLEGSSCGFDGEYSLWCFLKDVSFAEAFQYFSDPGSFETVVYEMEGYTVCQRTTFSGLIELAAILQEREQVNVRLKGVNVQIKKEEIPINQDDSVNEAGEENDSLRDETEN